MITSKLKISTKSKLFEVLGISEVDACTMEPKVFEYNNGNKQQAVIKFISDGQTTVKLKVGPPSSGVMISVPQNGVFRDVKPNAQGVCIITFTLHFTQNPNGRTVGFYVKIEEVGTDFSYKFNCFLQ